MPILLNINSAEVTEEKAQHFFERAMDPVSTLDIEGRALEEAWAEEESTATSAAR